MVVQVTQQNYKQEIEQASKPVVLDAYTTWCGPCIQMAPHFEELAEQHSDKFVFAKVNVDEARDIAVELGVSSVPTFLFFKQGKLIGSEAGYMSKPDLEEKILKILG